jgi:hypothetical protein
VRRRHSRPKDRADSQQFRRGVLNVDAVNEIRSFSEFPVLWLGDEFKGWRLTSVQRTSIVTPAQGPFPEFRDDRISLVYGSCERAPGDWGCTPPVAIIIWAPGAIPGPSGVSEEAVAERGATRGLPSAVISESTVLWADGGVAIQIHSNGDIRQEVVDELRLANARAVGLPEVGARESLLPLKEGARPSPTALPTDTPGATEVPPGTPSPALPPMPTSTAQP